MQRRQSNRVNMINATIGYCDERADETAGIVKFGVVMGELKAKMVLVNAMNMIGSGSTKGVTMDTNAVRRVMTELAYKCANATMAYAHEVNNNTLLALVRVTEEDFRVAKKEDVDDICQRIHDAAADNFDEVAGYGISGTDVTDLQAGIDVYRTGCQNPRNARVTCSQAKRRVEVLVREAIDDILVGKLDRMVNTLKVAKFDFWRGYNQARMIVDIGVTHAKVRGWVRDEEDVPLVGVAVRITEAGTEKVMVAVKSVEKGRYTSGRLPSGLVDLEWSLEGYETVKELNVKIRPGKEMQRKVVMKRGVGSEQ